MAYYCTPFLFLMMPRGRKMTFCMYLLLVLWHFGILVDIGHWLLFHLVVWHFDHFDYYILMLLSLWHFGHFSCYRFWLIIMLWLNQINGKKYWMVVGNAWTKIKYLVNANNTLSCLEIIGKNAHIYWLLDYT